MQQNELTHHGVKGMKWGVRKKYVTVAQGVKNARQAGQDAWRKTTTESGGKLIGKSKSIAVYKNPKDAINGRAKSKAAYKEAATESIKNDKARNKQVKEDVINAKKSAVKKYEKKFNEAEKASNIADKKWNEVSEQRKKLGKNAVQRFINASGKSEDARKYRKMFDDAISSEDIADVKWKEAREAYKKTGRTYVGRILNNVKYGS